MSSHHIIRDEQEPALILAELDSFPFDLLGQLLEWAPYTICLDNALDQALDYEINLDVVISSREGLDKLLGYFPGVIVLKEDVPSQSIDFLTNRGHKAVNIVTSDPFILFDWMHQMNEKILLDVITPTYKYIRVEKQITKWMPASSRLALIGENSYQVTGGSLIDNSITVEMDGMVSIKATSPFILGLSN